MSESNAAMALLRFFPDSSSPGQQLQALTRQLQPLLQKRETLLSTLPTPQRSQLLAQLNQQLRTVGLPRFNDLLAKLCRAYFQRYGGEPGVEIEDFILEVQILTCTRLLDYDPSRANFHTWFTTRILPRVYSDMQRQRNPHWGRPQPTTPEGQLNRATALNLARGLSLEQGDFAVADYRRDLDTHLLEEQCSQWFRETLSSFSLADQLLVQRIYIQGESQKELAQTLGISPATLCGRLKKLCQRLSQQLGTEFMQQCSETEFCKPLREEQ